MKKKQQLDETNNWASPQAILEKVNKRGISIATREENEEHMRRVREFGTRENYEHERLRNFRRKTED